ncbi:MAG: PEP-CTERM sorting domain-containing protein [Betaproteobacteria bacterium]|nr:PEP-CTERM sorting domain-containing protein [Betaproteobacteria bacterium]
MHKFLTTLLASSFSLSAFAAVDSDGLFDSWLNSGRETIVSAPDNRDDAVFSGDLFITDTAKPVEFTFVFSQSHDGLKLEVATIFANNAYSAYQTVFSKSGDSYNDTGWFVSSGGKTPNSYTYTYNLPTEPEAVVYGTPPSVPERIILRFTDTTTGKVWFGQLQAGKNSDSVDHMVVFYDYSNGQALVGFEETYRYPQNMPAGNDWRDYDDFVILISNVNGGVFPPTPTIPEPESWVMLLAGLGMVSITARSRRRWNR